MKLANQTGVVYKLTGKRRNPWVAKAYIGKIVDDEHKKVRYRYKTIGYFSRKTDAYKALLTYKEKPVITDAIPLSRVYEEWSSIHFEQIADSSESQYRNAWNHIPLLHDKDIRSIRTADIESAVEYSDPPRTVRANIKILLSMMYKYALAHDYCVKDYSSLINVRGDKTNTTIKRKVYTPEEIKQLFARDDVIADMTLIGIYTGMRPGELCALSLSEIDGEFLRIHGSKTKSGLFRDIPIHPDILPLIQRNAAKSAVFGQKKVFLRDDKHPVLRRYYAERLEGHTPHDTRHSFVTYCRRSGMDQLAVKKIVGHSTSRDITEDVYTHTDDDFLKTEMAKFTIA